MPFSGELARWIGNNPKKRASSLPQVSRLLQIERLEDRMMLNGDTGSIIFSASFEDVEVPLGGFQFASETSGFKATRSTIELQHNHPSVGPASDGNNHVELDGTNGMFVEIDNVPDGTLLLQVDYSPRPGVDASQASVQVLWNNQVVTTIKRDGSRLRTTDFNRVEIELPSTNGVVKGRLEFRSTSPEDRTGLGGLIDNVKVVAPLGQLKITEIADQEVQVGASLRVNANLDPPNQNLDVTYSLVDAPVGATINTRTGQFTWNATQENIDATLAQPSATIVGDPFLVFRAGFEDVPVPNGGFALFPEVSGFRATQGRIEVQDNHPSVGPASEGRQHVELDVQNGMFRDVPTMVGDRYELRFDYSPRKGVDANNNAIEVWWDGKRARRVTNDGRGNRSTEFRSVTVDLSEFSGDLTRLEFRSNNPEDRLGLGGLIDNVRLFRRRVTTVEPSDKVNVTVRVRDSNGRIDNESFEICLVDQPSSQAPVLDPIADRTINERQSIDVF